MERVDAENPVWQRLLEAEVPQDATSAGLAAVARWAVESPTTRVLACPCPLLARLGDQLATLGCPDAVGVCAIGRGPTMADGAATLKAEVDQLTAFDESSAPWAELWAYETDCGPQGLTKEFLADLDCFQGIEVFVRTRDLEGLAAAEELGASIPWVGLSDAASFLWEAVSLDIGFKLRGLPDAPSPDRLCAVLAAIDSFDWSTKEAREALTGGLPADIDPSHGRDWLRSVQWSAAKAPGVKG